MKVSLGIFVELIKSKALLAKALMPTELEKEHVTINMYDECATSFKLYPFEDYFFKISPDTRLTMDTLQDFNSIDYIIQKLNLNPPIDEIKLRKILNLVENSGLLTQMNIENSKNINSKKYDSLPTRTPSNIGKEKK